MSSWWFIDLVPSIALCKENWAVENSWEKFHSGSPQRSVCPPKHSISQHPVLKPTQSTGCLPSCLGLRYSNFSQNNRPLLSNNPFFKESISVCFYECVGHSQFWPSVKINMSMMNSDEYHLEARDTDDSCDCIWTSALVNFAIFYHFSSLKENWLPR